MGVNKVSLADEVIIDISNDTVVSGSLRQGYTAHGHDGELVEGSMPEEESVNYTITSLSDISDTKNSFIGEINIRIDSDSKSNIVAENIKSGVNILGIDGSYEILTQDKTATPTFESQDILPDSEYDAMKKVTIDPIPVEGVTLPNGSIHIIIGGTT